MDKNLERYSRQVFFPSIGEEGQRRLLNSYVALMGCGALGTVIASSLARAGVGRLKIVDRDFVEENNLQRQILFDEDDVKENLPKAVAAHRKLEKINSHIQIESLVTDVNPTNVEGIIKGADLVMDGTDNFETRYLINDACVKHKIPWIYGACVSSYGLSMSIIPYQTPCLRCVLETAPPAGATPTCDTAGVIGPIVNTIASLQVTAGLKILTQNWKTLRPEIVMVDIWEGTFTKADISNSREASNCPACKQGKFEFLEGQEGSHFTVLCGRDAVQITQRAP
ncbi:MAG: ThiF family adenylyltransferase, partial [Nitrospira sp.]|nr:ThiF family adenylyltransferase [Nitrospira sp.]